MKSIKSRKKSTLLRDNAANEIISDSADILRSADYNEDQIAQFTDSAVSILNDYAELIGEGTEIEYRFSRGLLKYELKMAIQGEPYDPFKTGSEARNRKLADVVNINLNTETVRVSYQYTLGYNIISVIIPLAERKKPIFRDPMVLAPVLGIVLGLLCQRLPDAANSFIVNDLASPFLSIILKMLSGIMGPVIFISMTTSIIALDSINDLTNLGFKIVKRFIVIALFLTVVSIAVSGVFFRSFGTGSISFAPQQLIQMILDVIPTNLYRPFLDNNTPQLVILGFLLGAALLVLDDSVSGLKDMLMQVNKWIMSAMRIVLMVGPVVPFLSIFTTIAKGNGSSILEGWKFIAASYIVFSICVAVKAVKASVKTGIGIPEFWSKIKPIVMMTFTTGSTSVALKKVYEVSEKDFRIKPEFSSFWIPMCSAMLSPKTTINVVIATFMVAEITGVAVTTSFLIVLILVTLELSIASPGTTSAWTIMFETLSMPTGYVGLFSVFKVFTNNFSAACTEAYSMFEEVEAAYKLDGIDQTAALN